jgi:hypothetical protein
MADVMHGTLRRTPVITNVRRRAWRTRWRVSADRRALTAGVCGRRYTTRVRLRPGVASLVEWVVAGLVVALLAWLVVAGIWPRLASHEPTVTVEAEAQPAGVPADAHSVPLLVLVDGTTLRVGESLFDIHARIGSDQADAQPVLSEGAFGDRLTHRYTRHGTTFLLVAERTEPGGPVRVVGIYLPR